MESVICDVIKIRRETTKKKMVIDGIFMTSHKTNSSACISDSYIWLRPFDYMTLKKVLHVQSNELPLFWAKAFSLV